MATRTRKTDTTPANEASYFNSSLEATAGSDYDDIALFASLICNVPMALVTLVDGNQYWSGTKAGMSQSEIARYAVFYAHAAPKTDEMLIVEDAAADPRFTDVDFLTSRACVRFYVAVPVESPDGGTQGTLCVMDQIPRRLETRQIEALLALARRMAVDLRARRVIDQLTLKDQLMERETRELRSLQVKLTQDNSLLRAHSLTDTLTDIPNRRAFTQQLAMAVAHARRHGESLSLVVIDVDRFKSFNDDFGHNVGDEVLRGVAGILQSSARRGDFVARYGGEEFAVICPGASEEQAQAVADRLRTAVRAMRFKERGVTISAGVASLVRDSLDEGECMIQSADHALYQAKANGRDLVVGFTSLPPQTPRGRNS